MDEVCALPGGHTLFREPNKAGGHTYWSDEIGGGVIIYDTCLHNRTTMLIALAEEARREDAEKRAAHDAHPAAVFRASRD